MTFLDAYCNYIIAKRHSLPYNNDEVENAVKDDPTIETRLIKAVDDVMNTHGICCFSERFLVL